MTRDLDFNTPKKKPFSDHEIIKIPSSPHTCPNLFPKSTPSAITISKKHARNNQSRGLITGQLNRSATRQIVEQFRQSSIKQGQIDKNYSRVPFQFGLSSPKQPSELVSWLTKSSKSTLTLPPSSSIIQSANRKLILWAGNADAIGWTTFIRLGTTLLILQFHLLLLNLRIQALIDYRNF